MRDHSHHIELSREEAVSRMLERCGFDGMSCADEGDAHVCEVHRKKAEQVAVADSIGRVLAYDVQAQNDMPSCLTCAMDSIAVHWSDFADGIVPDTSAWVRGVDWQFANTGVAMPEGFDTAIVIEHVEVSDDEQHVEIKSAPSGQYAGTRPVGSQMRRFDLVAEAGSVITSDLAARIASGNNASVAVVRRPRVAFIPTGNELVPPGTPFSPDAPDMFAARGKNFETNSILVKGKTETWGGDYLPFDIVPDTREAIRSTIERAVEVADIVVLNAGSSKGSDDWSVEVLEEMGDVICHQTNHGPGHHSSYALVDGVPIVGISGPSGGASFTLNFYLRPLIMKWLGLPTEPRMIPVRLEEEFPQVGPSPSAQKTGPGKPLPGEVRPSVVKGDDLFFGIKFLSIRATEEGTLVGTPVAGRPGSSESQIANAYYMMPTGGGTTPPRVGDVIHVEMR